MLDHEGHNEGASSAGADRSQVAKADAVPAKGEDSTEPAASAQQPPAGVQSVEPQDAHLIGASGSLQRKLLAQNTSADRKDGRKPQAQPEPDLPAGQHATGSSDVEPSRKK